MTIAAPRDYGISGWQAIIPTLRQYPPLQEDITADWLIIGAGWAGLAAAQRLVEWEPQARIVVVDACAISHSPAGRNSGFMIDIPHDLSSADYAGSLVADQHTMQQNRVAIDFVVRMTKEYAMPGDTVQPIGKIKGAATASGIQHLKDFVQHLQVLGVDHDVYDAADMQRITGSRHYHGGLFCPGVTLVQPAQYIQHLTAGLAQRGVHIYESTPVQSYEKRGKGWHIRTAHGSIGAGQVVLAVNGQLPRFGYHVGRLMHVFTFAAMTSVLDDSVDTGVANWGITSAHPMGTSVRKYTDRHGHCRLLLRNRFTYAATPEISDAAFDSGMYKVRQHFDKRYPALRDLSFACQWAGRLCLSRNGVQVVGALEDNLYAACCQNGLGTTRGTLAGLAVIDHLHQSGQGYIDGLWDQATPKRLLPEPVAGIGAKALLAWRHWRAGWE